VGTFDTVILIDVLVLTGFSLLLCLYVLGFLYIIIFCILLEYSYITFRFCFVIILLISLLSLCASCIYFVLFFIFLYFESFFRDVLLYDLYTYLFLHAFFLHELDFILSDCTYIYIFLLVLSAIFVTVMA